MELIDTLYFKVRNRFAFHWPIFYSYCDYRKSFLKFLLAGTFSSALDILFLFILHGLFNVGLVLSTSLAFVIVFCVSFFLQKRWTFRQFSHKHTGRQLTVYLANSFLGLNLNGILMHLLVVRFGFWYILSQIVVNLVIGLYNFFIYKYLIFRQR
ncbi:GtrA family protein [Candidatus Falkowbacteria bacterium]|nr:GtrA family protein [Candidatus Falkowbacteria bacterium]NCT55165.1 GtrA family protein [Candidatus Falkowbacteria bacterium]